MRIARSMHPDACTLMIAAGASRRAVSFFNERTSTPVRMEARKKTAEFINEKMKLGHSYDSAHKMLDSHPELRPALPFVEIKLPKSSRKSAAPGGAQFANAESDPCPWGGPQYMATFFLPANATQGQFQCAWRANGSQAVSINPAKIFAGLVELTQRRERGDYDAAIAICKRTFPKLWDAVELLAEKPD